MRKLLNTIYVTNEQMYLMLDGENLVCKAEGEIKLRIPFENVENIVCFSYLSILHYHVMFCVLPAWYY